MTEKKSLSLKQYLVILAAFLLLLDFTIQHEMQRKVAMRDEMIRNLSLRVSELDEQIQYWQSSSAANYTQLCNMHDQFYAQWANAVGYKSMLLKCGIVINATEPFEIT